MGVGRDAPFGSPFTPAEALPSAFLLLQVVTDHGLTWNFAAWSLSVEWISYLLFPLLIPLAVTRSRWSHLAPLLALTVLAFIVHSRGTLDVTSGALAVGRGVSEFVLGLWLLPRVKAAKGLPMMKRDLPLLIAFVLPFALMQFTMTPQLTLLLIGSYILLIWIAAAQGERQSPLLRLLDNRFANWLGISPTPSICSMRWCCSLAASSSTIWHRGSPSGGIPKPTRCWG